MASYQFFIAALVLVLVQQSNGQDGPTTITINPEILTMMPNVSDSTGGQVTISCRASSVPTVEYLSVINIQRVLHANPNAAPVMVAAASVPDDTVAVLKLTSLDATVSGGLTDKSITLILNRANCGDAGMYICNANSIYNGQTKTYTASKNLTVEVSPGSISMTTDPSGVTIHRVNDTLLMRCNGVVGTVQDDSQVEWIWEYQDGNRFAGVENWQPYSDIGNPSADIQTESSPSTSSCYKRQISVLTRHLTLDDTDREYRCYVINNEMSGNQNAQANAQVISVGTVSESDPGTGGQSPSTGDGSGSPAKADVGAIVGGVVGALIVVVVIIVIVYFLVIRKRRQQDKPDPSKPADEQPPPGYSTGPDPHVTYSQPVRSNNRFKKDKEDKARGQTNKAMDDADDKPYKPRHSPQPQDYDTKPSYESKPARYENDIGRDYDRNQGRRNRAYDDDGPRTPRRYSSDDGGTDTNVNMNTSMHSMHSVGRGDPNIGTAI